MELPENTTAARVALNRARGLTLQGSWDEAIDLLTEENRREENADIELRLITLRHKAFSELTHLSPPEPPSATVRDHFPGISTIPEIAASELSVELIISAIQHHGALLVRGLFGQDAIDCMRHSIDEAFAGAAMAANNDAASPSPWYTHFRPVKSDKYNFGGYDRAFASFGAGVLSVDSPRALFRYIECLKGVGFDKILREYLGERPVFSARKSTLRLTPPDARTGWHQDAVAFGMQTRSLNIWAAFSHCGIHAPSLDICAKRFESLVPQGGEGIDDRVISEESAERFGSGFIVRPVFEPGDAVLMDQLTMHRTGTDTSMTESRYAIEMWFFAASQYPDGQVPLCI